MEKKKCEKKVMLRNGSAVACIHMGKFDEAEKLLLDAITKGQNDPDTLVNLICCYQHMSKSEELIARYMSIS
jgi:coatomer subunit epsilon